MALSTPPLKQICTSPAAILYVPGPTRASALIFTTCHWPTGAFAYPRTAATTCTPRCTSATPLRARGIKKAWATSWSSASIRKPPTWGRFSFWREWGPNVGLQTPNTPFTQCTRAACLSCERATRSSCPSRLLRWCTARTLLAISELSVWICKSTSEELDRDYITHWVERFGAATQREKTHFNRSNFLSLRLWICEGCMNERHFGQGYFFYRQRNVCIFLQITSKMWVFETVAEQWTGERRKLTQSESVPMVCIGFDVWTPLALFRWREIFLCTADLKHF